MATRVSAAAGAVCILEADGPPSIWLSICSDGTETARIFANRAQENKELWKFTQIAGAGAALVDMNIVLHDIRRGDDGLIQLTISLGSQQPRLFRATYDGSDPHCVFANLEQELFMVLSNMAFRRFGNCVVYQHELMKLIGAFCDDAPLPGMPVTLGTTPFCTLMPGPSRVAWNKLWIFLRRLGLYRPRSGASTLPKGAGIDIRSDDASPIAGGSEQ